MKKAFERRADKLDPIEESLLRGVFLKYMQDDFDFFIYLFISPARAEHMIKQLKAYLDKSTRGDKR